VTDVSCVVIVAAVVVVLDAYWPHRPGPKYINPGKKITVNSKFGIKIYHIRTSI